MSIVPRYSSRDLEGLPDIDGVRYEIIDGDLHVPRQPQWHHQFACLRIGAALQAWSDETDAGEANVAPGLIFADDDDVAPDVVWISRARLNRLLDQAGHLSAAPELVVEVLSPGTRNEARDRNLKLKLYSRQGVLEYWLVDWPTEMLQVYRHVDGVLLLATTLTRGDTLTSPLLPGFSCPVAALFRSRAERPG